ncbi:hypothetical protein ACTXI4_18075 [Glutamicibacter ardleyensis]|uniref:hypothetical protein n=1 Tax=Glutamicibacter ardleyensis TaxID=225894 RepID=UPI003FCF809D
MFARVSAAPFRLETPRSQRQREAGVLAVLGWLSAFPGETWQQCWEASGAEAAGDWRELISTEAISGCPSDAPTPPLSVGLLVLICADVIRPSLRWLLSFAPARKSLTREMARTRDTKVFSVMDHTCVTEQVGLLASQRAMIHISVIMAAKGGRVADIEVGDCVELAEITATLPKDSHGTVRSPLFCQLLLRQGVLGKDAPAALAMFCGRG